MRGKRRPTSRRWSEEELAERFGWWWRNPEAALRAAFPHLSSHGRSCLFRKTLNLCAFNYELAARAKMECGGEPAYEFGKRFPELKPKEMSVLHLRWRRKNDPQPLVFLPYSERPITTSVLGILEQEESSVTYAPPLEDDRKAPAMNAESEAKAKAAHEIVARKDTAALARKVASRARQEARIINAAKQGGWTIPRYLTVNLRQHTDGAICTEFRKWLQSEREALGIAEPPQNKNVANRTKKKGRSFHMIEVLDVRVHLSPGDSTAERYDDSLKSKAQELARILAAEVARLHEQKREEDERIARFLAARKT